MGALSFPTYPEEYPKLLHFQAKGSPWDSFGRRWDMGKKIFSETAEIIMLVQSLSSSPIDLHKDDGILMSLRSVLFCQISLKLANRFKSYRAGDGEKLTNSKIIVSWGKKKRIIEAWIC